MNRLTKILILLLLLCSAASSAPLFEVKNDVGKIIMEVSDDGVRFFNPQYTPVGTEKDTLMIISATNIKAMVRKAGGGSANRDFDIAETGSIRKGTGKSVMKMSVQNDYGIGGDSAIVFYKPKNAFRAQSIIQDLDSVGQTSFASGYLCQASGEKTTAMGTFTKAKGHYSTAFGYGTVASGQKSTAMGVSSTAKSYASTSLGRYNKIEGSFDNWVDTDPLFVIGNGSSSTPANAFEVKKNGNTYIPSLFTTVGSGKFVKVDATGKLGVTGLDIYTAFGSHTSAYGMYSTAFGYYTNAYGMYSTAFGQQTRAQGTNSTATGYYTFANGDYSTSAGYRTVGTSFGDFVIGQYNRVTSGNPTAWEPTDPLFIVGNGLNENSHSNAFEVKKNGNTYIPSLYTTIGSGKYVLVDSYGKLGVSDLLPPKEQSATIEVLQKENSDLKTRVAKLEALMEQIRNK